MRVYFVLNGNSPLVSIWYDVVYDKIYLLTAVWLTPGVSSTVHIYTQTMHRTTELTNWEECRSCPVFASYTLAFTLQLAKHGKTSVRVEKNLSQGKKKLFYIKHQCLLILLQSYLNMMTYFGTFDVRKSVHHHTIQINQPTRCDSFTSLLLDVCVWLSMFWAPFRPSSGAYSCIGNLRFYCCRVAVAAATTTHQR
jgi:hypothetical protein